MVCTGVQDAMIQNYLLWATQLMNAEVLMENAIDAIYVT